MSCEKYNYIFFRVVSGYFRYIFEAPCFLLSFTHWSRSSTPSRRPVIVEHLVTDCIQNPVKSVHKTRLGNLAPILIDFYMRFSVHSTHHRSAYCSGYRRGSEQTLLVHYRRTVDSRESVPFLQQWMWRCRYNLWLVKAHNHCRHWWFVHNNIS